MFLPLFLFLNLVEYDICEFVLYCLALVLVQPKMFDLVLDAFYQMKERRKLEMPPMGIDKEQDGKKKIDFTYIVLDLIFASKC